MRILAMVSFALALVNGEAAERNVSVCIHKGGGLPGLHLAQMLTARIFAEIGTGIEWHCPSGSGQVIMIAMSTSTNDSDHPGVLAYAQPCTDEIKVFYDRTHNYAPQMRAYLLADVLAHEIAHVLQKTPRHSESGIMKAHWDDRDLRQVGSMGLAFTPYDVLLIHQGVAARLSPEALLARVN